jgi:transcriptional regulator with XRE-family HTH domain
MTGSTKRAVADRKHGQDPLVPIRGDRVRAALDRSGESVSELARRVGVSQQRVDLIANGTTKRCRRSLRTSIAKALGTSVRLLSDESKLPLAMQDAQGLDLAASPIARRQFVEAASRAIARDRIPTSHRGLPLGFLELLHPAYWRARLLPYDPHTLSLDDLSPTERDRLAAMMADVMLLALRPWLNGDAQLDGVHEATSGGQMERLTRSPEVQYWVTPAFAQLIEQALRPLSGRKLERAQDAIRQYYEGSGPHFGPTLARLSRESEEVR